MAQFGPSWTLDVSAMMVLIGEREESNYRMMERSLLECFSAAPVVGLQSYLQHYNWVQQCSNISYYSPLGCKAAPLRNMRFANAIETCDLLEDSFSTVYRVCPSSHKRSWKSCRILLASWLIVCWIIFFALLAFLFYGPYGTWIGRANFICFTSWSICVRVFERFLVRPVTEPSHISKPSEVDAICVLGRSNSCFVLEGSRADVKKWTTRALRLCPLTSEKGVFQKQSILISQSIVRICSLMVLVFIFATIPNGTTTDQISFSLLNALGQANTLIGKQLNARCLLSDLKQEIKTGVRTRTDTYAFLLRRYDRDVKGTLRSESFNLLPQTETWRRWRTRVVTEVDKDPKELYDIIADEVIAEKRANQDLSSL